MEDFKKQVWGAIDLLIISLNKLYDMVGALPADFGKFMEKHVAEKVQELAQKIQDALNEFAASVQNDIARKSSEAQEGAITAAAEHAQTVASRAKKEAIGAAIAHSDEISAQAETNANRYTDNSLAKFTELQKAGIEFRRFAAATKEKIFPTLGSPEFFRLSAEGSVVIKLEITNDEGGTDVRNEYPTQVITGYDEKENPIFEEIKVSHGDELFCDVVKLPSGNLVLRFVEIYNNALIEGLNSVSGEVNDLRNNVNENLRLINDKMDTLATKEDISKMADGLIEYVKKNLHVNLQIV